MENKLLTLPLDQSKRHFVVGDIHGRFDSFLALLDQANYDPASDVIYSVGDLIDRGPKSTEAVEFFTTQENVYTILGNHEYMAANPSEWLNVWINNGGDRCIESLKKHNKDTMWLRNRLEGLPWIIEVGSPSDENCFRIVHADAPPDWPDDKFKQVLEQAEDGEDRRVDALIWSRRTVTAALRNASNMRPTAASIVFHSQRKRHNFVGHTPTRGVVRVGDITFLDTWASRTLTMVEALTKDVYTVDVID